MSARFRRKRPPRLPYRVEILLPNGETLVWFGRSTSEAAARFAACRDASVSQGVTLDTSRVINSRLEIN